MRTSVIVDMSQKQCYIENCRKHPKYVIKWYEFNQDGEKPIVEDGRPVCSKFDHLVKAAEHDEFDGVPDDIVDFETWEKEYPVLLEQVIAAMKKD